MMMFEDWNQRLNQRPDWGKVVLSISGWKVADQAQLSDWVTTFRLNPNMALEAAILIEECRLQQKHEALQSLSSLEAEKGSLSNLFMKTLRTIRRPELEALRNQIALLKQRLQRPHIHIEYPDDLEQDEFELRLRIRSIEEWDALCAFIQEKRPEALALLETIKTGHVEA